MTVTIKPVVFQEGAPLDPTELNKLQDNISQVYQLGIQVQNATVNQSQSVKRVAIVDAGREAVEGLVKDKVKYMMGGGKVKPKYMNAGGMFKSVNTDTVPAMLSPGEFIMSRYAVKDFGLDNMKSINNGTYNGESVYNYSISVNVKSGANPDEIARSVMTQIKQIDSQRIRTQRVS